MMLYHLLVCTSIPILFTGSTPIRPFPCDYRYLRSYHSIPFRVPRDLRRPVLPFSPLQRLVARSVWYLKVSLFWHLCIPAGQIASPPRPALPGGGAGGGRRLSFPSSYSPPPPRRRQKKTREPPFRHATSRTRPLLAPTSCFYLFPSRSTSSHALLLQ